MNIPVDTAFRATWVPSPVDFGTIIGAATSVITALLDEITGGTPPYTINSIIFVGGPPAMNVAAVMPLDLASTTTFQHRERSHESKCSHRRRRRRRD